MQSPGRDRGDRPGHDLADDRMPDVDRCPDVVATPPRIASRRAALPRLLVEARHGADELLVGGPPDDREGLDRGARRR